MSSVEGCCCFYLWLDSTAQHSQVIVWRRHPLTGDKSRRWHPASWWHIPLYFGSPGHSTMLIFSKQTLYNWPQISTDPRRFKTFRYEQYIWTCTLCTMLSKSRINWPELSSLLFLSINVGLHKKYFLSFVFCELRHCHCCIFFNWHVLSKCRT